MKIYINGTEYAALRDYRIEEQAGNKTSTSISVEVGAGQPFPAASDTVEIYDGADCIFYGMCGIPKSPKYQTLHEKRIYSIVCGNANSILSNRIINEAFQNYTVSQIVRALFDRYVAEENITLGTISDISVTMEVYTAKDRNLQEALNELADLVSATWTITPDKEFNFIAAEDFPVFPETISSDFLLGTDLQLSCRDYKTRTVQIISGATDTTTEQYETMIYDGETNTFTTSFPLVLKPRMWVNGIYEVPANLIGVRGIDDDNRSIVFYFTFGSADIDYNKYSTAIESHAELELKAGDAVTASYYGSFPIRVMVINQTAVDRIAQTTGTSGKREQVELNTQIGSRADAQQLAESLLERFSEQTEELSFWLLSSELEAHGLSLDDTALLTAITFDLPEIGVEGKYVITARTIEPFDADLSGTKKITLKLSNRDYLKSHAETLTQLRRDINQLSVRGDETIVQPTTINEPVVLTESLTNAVAFGYFPVPAGDTLIVVPHLLSDPLYCYE